MLPAPEDAYETQTVLLKPLPFDDAVGPPFARDPASKAPTIRPRPRTMKHLLPPATVLCLVAACSSLHTTYEIPPAMTIETTAYDAAGTSELGQPTEIKDPALHHVFRLSDDIVSGAAYLSTFTSPKDVVKALRLTIEEIGGLGRREELR